MTAIALAARHEPMAADRAERRDDSDRDDRLPGDKRGFRAHLRTARSKPNGRSTDGETPAATPTPTPTPTPAGTQPLEAIQATASASTGDANPAQIAPIVAATPGIAIEAPPPVPAAPPPNAPTLEPMIALTPLEQAVHDLVERLRAPANEPHDEPHAEALPLMSAPAAVIDAPAPAPDVQAPKHAHAAAPAEPKPLPEQTNPSHVHLVLDDGPERVVVTVAVRGKEVNVALRGHDDTTAAALARNAGTLDHAMRARGLDLASFSSARDDDPRHGRQHDREPQRHDETHEPYEQFSFEELA